MSNKNMEMLGRAGETIVNNYFASEGHKVVLSEDQYDRHKDMTVDDLKVEVKTQVPYIYKDMFSIKPNQLKKCLNADKVVFVSVPSKKQMHHSDGKVYVIESKKLQYYPYTTKDGRSMMGIPIRQEGMEKLFELTDKQCRILQEYSVSGWN